MTTTLVNTFGLNISSKQVVELTNEQQLQQIDAKQNYFIVGGGSNLLFVNSPQEIILLPRFRGIYEKKRTPSHSYIKVGSGEEWDDVVTQTLAMKAYGMENLSAIPGTAGGATVQNIGAYGRELSEFIEEVEGFDICNASPKTWTNEECNYAYRNSLFKQQPNKYLITRITLKLPTTPQANTLYKGLAETLQSNDIETPSPQDVREAVIALRQSKLPQPSQLGSAGSFFKNPILPTKQYERLKQTYPSLTSFPDKEGVKIPAAWLIEQCGWKGYRKGDAGVYSRQALVLVNHGKATGREIWDLAQEIIRSVQEKFDITLSPEVIIVK